LSAFVTHLSQPDHEHKKPSGLSIKTIRLYLAAVKHTFALNGLPNPTEGLHVLPLILRGATRLRTEKRRTVRPLTISLLELLKSHIKTDTLKGANLWAALCMGVHGLFRSGEIIGKFGIKWENVSSASTDNTHIRINLDKSKTDPFGKGVIVNLFARSDTTCPVRALTQLRMLQGRMRKDRFVFRNAVGQRHYPLSSFMNEFRHALSSLASARPDLGLVAKEFAGHSMRRGGATSLFLRGVSELEIKIVGRWTSEAFRLYLDLTPQKAAIISKRTEQANTALIKAEIDAARDISNIPRNIVSFVDDDDL